MRQVVQNQRSGKVSVVEIPSAQLRSGGLLVRNVSSLISAGTERSVVMTARKSLVGKALERPDKVKQVLQVLRTEGFWAAYEKVQSKLSGLQAMGYSAAGEVVAVGADMTGYRVGARVACAGLGYAAHAEEFFVPKHLCSPIPAEVPFEHAAFTTLGAIALQGVRLAAPTLGETFVVIGLGLVGQLTVQLLAASGCRVIGVDFAADKIELALKMGADVAVDPTSDPVVEKIRGLTRERGADGVIITASSTSNEPVEQAGEMTRQKGRVVVVGAVGLELPRAPYFSKELSFCISMSYGPGRYDPSYEEQGHDYPLGYVRWTEQRNLEAVLDMMATGRLDPSPLISHRFAIAKGEDAYQLIMSDAPYLGVILDYPAEVARAPEVRLGSANGTARAGRASGRVGFIGAGGFAQGVLLPRLRKIAGTQLVGVATSTGIGARTVAENFGFSYCTTETARVLEDPSIDSIFIATRHDSHADLICRALEADKHVFVEKPLAITEEGLQRVREARGRLRDRVLMVGFNRRFSPAADAARAFFARRSGPLLVHVRANAGFLPASHWTQDPAIGGGRIIGEGCHYIDLLQTLIAADPIEVHAVSTQLTEGAGQDDNVVIVCRYADGSLGTITYVSTGDKMFPKERVEMFADGSVFVIEDFSSTTSVRRGKTDTDRRSGQDKGHAAELARFMDAVRTGGPDPIPFRELYLTTSLSLLAMESLRAGMPLAVPRIVAG